MLDVHAKAIRDCGWPFAFLEAGDAEPVFTSVKREPLPTNSVEQIGPLIEPPVEITNL
jgi:hypothetical protein